MDDFLTVSESAKFATEYTGRKVTSANISYLIRFGRIFKVDVVNGIMLISKSDLISYYDSLKESNSYDNNPLSFSDLKESDTTKHVHKIHPYKGKYIPQLVEYFLDEHTDNLKKNVYFHKGDIILDPFCGSGTTLVECNELGLHGVGIDVSEFNSFISNCKIDVYDIADVILQSDMIARSIWRFSYNMSQFEDRLSEELTKFNTQYFSQRNTKIDKEYSDNCEKMFKEIYNRLLSENGIVLNDSDGSTFLDKWYSPHIKLEIKHALDIINNVENEGTKRILKLILSRTARTCRATTHSDLTTLIEPVFEPYYCRKHRKICKPLFSILKWWESYCDDTILRLKQFNSLRTDTFQHCFCGDSRTIDLSLNMDLVFKRKASGIFSSPPYLGLIDYHEQHSYAYELFGFDRRDDLEIGPMFAGQGKKAQQLYIDGISDVLNNCKKFLIADYDIFLVANDKFNLYPLIAEKANMDIVERFERPVLNRSERNGGEYSETIFHLKEKKLL